jgi:hypothetical protein
MNHDNPMMIRFIGNEMALKTILLLCDPVVTINTLVSCVTCLEERFQPLITSTATSVTFSTNAKLCCHNNFLLIKDANALESRRAWVCKIMDLPPLIMMENKKQGANSEDRVGPF